MSENRGQIGNRSISTRTHCREAVVVILTSCGAPEH